MVKVPNVFTECTEVGAGDPLRQGDVFIFVDDGHEQDLWRWGGIVVTADCDLANNKHGGIVSYVPVLPLRDYLMQRLLPKYAEDVRQRRFKAPLDLIADMENDSRRSSRISRRAVESWVAQPNCHAEMMEHFKPANADRERRLEDLVNAIQICGRALDSSSYEEIVAVLAELHPPTKKSTPEQRLVEEIRNRLRNLPGDSFFMSSIGSDDEGGFVAYLRLVREIRMDQVATNYYDRQVRSVAAHRVSRLRAPYVYRLTQQLAEVFASIGLPEEYENSRTERFESCLQMIAPSPEGV